MAARDVGASLILPSNPVAALIVGPRRESDGVNPVRRGLQYVAHLEQTIEVGGQRGARREVVRRALDVASAREALALSESRARIRTAYIAGLITAAQAHAARSREVLVSQLYEAVKVKVEKGAGSQINLKLAEIETGRLARQRLAADLASVESVATLAALIGLPPRSAIALTTPLGGPKVHLPPFAALLADARATGPSCARWSPRERSWTPSCCACTGRQSRARPSSWRPSGISRVSYSSARDSPSPFRPGGASKESALSSQRGKPGWRRSSSWSSGRSRWRWSTPTSR